MTFSMRRINAIFQKDFKDISRNSAVSVTVLMPLIIAFVMGKMGDDIAIEAHYMVINFSMVIVGSFVQCSLIAEEKEKNTLRGLMLSPASTLEILGGKSLLSLIATMIIVVIGAFFTGYRPEHFFVIAIAILFSSFFFIGLGTLLGLLAKSVMEASVIILPFMFVFSFGSMITMFADKYPILNVVNYTPNMQLMEIAVKVESGIGFGGVWLNLGIITLWIIGIFVLTIIVFKKKRMD
ncbi:ABC transporter permease subunit [Sporosarcina sp. ANT_H38]|uniref:ABC transporter permease n=1 Tax=Sporosarcina sp. ANT_H38 TaxID=2597358 RepID=UPI0011F2CBAD|nr:ABC transporter permease [Sporosarcina sp. ANT_H38]KAA0942068.1 ABC transporter permease subunit [Sporosarcina sp. ANT_H38]